MGPINVQHMYRNRIDILKRFGKKFTPSKVDENKYQVLPHGQIVKRLAQDRTIIVNGDRVTIHGTSK